jgi:hypothetical protein
MLEKRLGLFGKRLDFAWIPWISFSESSLFNELRRPLGRNLLWGPSRREERAEKWLTTVAQAQRRSPVEQQGIGCRSNYSWQKSE